ncbi:hypothetical protein ONZ51_g12437 [Trametes cubensis]|uniref:CST complex subunit STN1 n=1 Tax=Trametes cubensis TaxID=1111947 RepID=A0AAD7X3J8_9APHY|nr:hypothetical protein ONZ51_g12437 [Trametes cubensis]
MSATSTVVQSRSNISRSTSSILLSPSKRRRAGEAGPSGCHAPASLKESRDAGEKGEDDSSCVTPADIHKWTFTRAAVAPCFVRDVFEMRESGYKDMEFFWLGRIPCRTVHLVGLVVGVAVWDKRTIYTVDDGTGVVDCAYTHARAALPSPMKPKAKESHASKDKPRGNKPSFADYLPSSRAGPSTSATASKRAVTEPPPPPKPVARVGQSVHVVGRVVSRHDTRLLVVDEISRCTSFNDEPSHRLKVSELHRTRYHPVEKLPPFIPPPLPSVNYATQFYPPSQPGTPTKGHRTQVPGTPASVHSIASTTTSPSTAASASSPASNAGDVPQSPVRLRHPARLHTRDLTVHTLRIYIKHYMDNAPPPSRHPRRSSNSRSTSPSPTPRASQARRQDVHDTRTPTISRIGRNAARSEETPRPTKVRLPGGTSSSHAVPASDTEDEDDDAQLPEDDDQVYGYTLSHLRRVPELALLAKRIVKADAHRRDKEERKKAKAKAKAKAEAEGSQAKGKTKSSSSQSTSMDPKALAAGTKRLFRQAIRTLFQDGSIVLWDGPVRPLPTPMLDPLVPSSFSSALWKANTSVSSSMSTSTSQSQSQSQSQSKSSRSFPSYEDWDEDAPLSDPEPNEEAYIPLIPVYFSRVLERAITNIMDEAQKSAVVGDATPRPARKTTSLIERLRAQDAGVGTARSVPGPTAEELLAWLRSSDERWARVGVWSVEEALEWGRKEGRVWCVGKGRWEVCG